MGNFEAFIGDYMEYKNRRFTTSEKSKGIVAIVAAATGTVLGIWGLISLTTLLTSMAIPGINLISGALGVTITPAMIFQGLKIIAKDDSWSKMDHQSRMNIIAAIVFFQCLFTLDISSLMD